MTGRLHDPLTRLPPPPGPWTRRAACHDLWELMDPPEGERTEYARRAALAVCRSCPVLAECREWVIALPASADPGGVTGGWTEYQRGLERGRRSRARQRAEQRPAVTSKKCIDCGQTRPADAFHRDPGRPDGLTSYCGDCKRVRNRRRFRTEGAA